MKRLLLIGFVLGIFSASIVYGADVKLSDLGVMATDAADTDIIYVVADPGGTPAGKKITKSNFVKDAALGTPSAIVLTNASGTAAININGTVGATTPAAGAFTTLAITGVITGAVNTLSYSANQQLSSANANGSFITATAAMTLELPDTLVAGNSGCLLGETGDSTIIGLNPGDGNYLVVDGVTMTASTTYAATAAVGNKICWVATSATVAYVTSESGTWSE